MSNDPFEHDRPAYVDEDMVPFDPRQSSDRRAMWILGGLFAAAIVAVIIIFNLYQPGTRDRDDPPRISADNRPFKVEPDNPGGNVTPDQDKKVYDAMNGSLQEEDVQTVDVPEEPIELPDAATIIVDDSDTVDDVPSETETPAATDTPEPAIVTAPETEPELTPAQSDYVVQVASVRSRQDAENIWTSIESKYGSILPAGTTKNIKRVDLDEKGIYFRLRIDGLASKSAASALCESLKAQGQACFVAGR